VAVKGATLLAWHPTRQRLLTASTAAVVEYDAVSGSRRNLVEVVGTPLGLAYTPSGGVVILLTKVGVAGSVGRWWWVAAAMAQLLPAVCCRSLQLGHAAPIITMHSSSIPCSSNCLLRTAH
jgi:hypothetical protein